MQWRSLYQHPKLLCCCCQNSLYMSSANSWGSSCPHCHWGIGDGVLARHWEENCFAFVLTALECVHVNPSTEKSSSHPKNNPTNTPDHYHRCSSGSPPLHFDENSSMFTQKCRSTPIKRSVRDRCHFNCSSNVSLQMHLRKERPFSH